VVGVVLAKNEYEIIFSFNRELVRVPDEQVLPAGQMHNKRAKGHHIFGFGNFFNVHAVIGSAPILCANAWGVNGSAETGCTR